MIACDRALWMLWGTQLSALLQHCPMAGTSLQCIQSAWSGLVMVNCTNGSTTSEARRAGQREAKKDATTSSRLEGGIEHERERERERERARARARERDGQTKSSLETSPFHMAVSWARGSRFCCLPVQVKGCLRFECVCPRPPAGFCNFYGSLYDW